MSKTEWPDQETLLRLLSYNPENGELHWLRRTPDLFGICKYPEAQCARWNGKYAGKRAFRLDHLGYYSGFIFGQKTTAHRVVWCMVHGYWPGIVDHINQDRSDNRIVNLAEVTTAENSRNARLSKRNKSGRTGVFQTATGKWRARIGSGKNAIALGLYEHFADAVKAREDAEIRCGYSARHGSKRISE